MKIFLLVVFPLGFGAAIYFIDRIVRVPALIRDYLPDALWSFAFANCWFLTGDKDVMNEIASLLICLLIVFIVEVLQLLQFVPGTFDPIDIGVMFSSCFISFFIIRPSKHSSAKIKSL